MPVTFHRLAAREYLIVRQRYSRYSAQTATRFEAAVDAAVRRIEANPPAGAPFRATYRWIRVRRYPYLLYYEELGPQAVRILAVAHARRRLGYWLRRANRP